MKFLLDEMWSRVIAEELRSRGLDAESVDERPSLRSQSDEELLRLAAEEGRALVTENIRDFQELAHAWRNEGRKHAGIVFTPVGRFPRAGNRGVGRLIASLERLSSVERNLTNLELWPD